VIQAEQPLRIKVITVQPGDTVESLSYRMAGADRAGGAVSGAERAGAACAGEGEGPGEDYGGLRFVARMERSAILGIGLLEMSIASRAKFHSTGPNLQ
jgi:hypothetical protein